MSDMRRRLHALAVLFAAALASAALAGCRQDMHDQPRGEPLQASTFFPDGSASRPLVAGTIARGDLRNDTLLYTGMSGDQPAAVFPFPITDAVMARGRERFDIFCSPCHGLTGRGDGMVVRRGFRRPPTFHSDRLRTEPPGHFFDVMTNGFGAMPSYASQIPVRDRWAITAYIRALQLSEHATMDDVPAGERGRLE
jgi:hypothetical protein